MHKQALHAMLGIDGHAIDTRLIPMLRSLREHRSLAAAARAAGLSYRHAWGELGRITDALGGTLVELQRGRGATITAAGEALLKLHQALDTRLAAALPALNQALALGQPAQTPVAARALRIYASHDFALASLRELALARRFAVDLHFQGSLEALQALADSHCDVAGFHVAITPLAAAGPGALAPLLRNPALRLIEFAIRSQGLMIKPGGTLRTAKTHGANLRVSTLADLARGGTRFVNRQPGSGTRLLLDRLLAIEGIAPENIRGYRDEEFTHAAVAATVASGKADAGFGIEAAARAQKLAFIPIATERYLLATRAATLRQPAMGTFCDLLDSTEFGRVLAKLPGYTAPASHEPQRVADVFRETRTPFR